MELVGVIGSGGGYTIAFVCVCVCVCMNIHRTLLNLVPVELEREKQIWYKSTYICNLGKLYRNGDAEVNNGLLDITGKDRVG